MQLVCLAQMLLAYKAEARVHDLLKMGLLAILIPVSNAKHNHVSLTFADNASATVDVGAVLQQKYTEMLDDLRPVKKMPCGEAAFIVGTAGF